MNTKFRVWEIDRNEMNYKVLIGNCNPQDGNYTAHSLLRDGKWLNFDENSNVIIQQYTDLYDRNNKRVCEGDLVKYTQHKGLVMPSFEFEVVKNSKKACFGYYENEDGFVAFAEFDELEEDFLSHCEIIGNKYESNKNP